MGSCDGPAHLAEDWTGDFVLVMTGTEMSVDFSMSTMAVSLFEIFSLCILVSGKYCFEGIRQ